MHHPLVGDAVAQHARRVAGHLQGAADGEITRIDVRPDWAAVDTIGVTVMTLPLRPTRHTSGRALQVASDPARIVRDGVPYPRPVDRWTWYADDRVRWRLKP